MIKFVTKAYGTGFLRPPASDSGNQAAYCNYPLEVLTLAAEPPTPASNHPF